MQLNNILSWASFYANRIPLIDKKYGMPII